MGGREIEILAGLELNDRGDRAVDADRVSRAIEAVASLKMIIPPLVPGVGPFPRAGSLSSKPAPAASEHMALAHLYAAMLADTSLDLIGSSDTLLIEGRFASAPVFIQALAGLRPGMRILVGADEDGITRGALNLGGVPQPKRASLRRVPPLAIDLAQYRAQWREAAERGH
jgi:hypothetical protein